MSTAWPTGTSTSSVQFVEDQGGFVPITRAADGTIVAGATIHDYRTSAYIQTDANVTHYVHVSKDHVNRKFGAEVNIYNVFNQHAATGYNEIPLTASMYAATTTNPVGVDWKTMESGWDYVGLSNINPVKASLGNKTVNSSYGLPNSFQAARQLRIKIAYIF